MSDWCVFNFRAEDDLSGVSQSAHLVVLGAGLQQALLNGELQQVLLLLPHAVSLFATKHGVSRWGLKHTRGNLSSTTRHYSTQGEGRGQEIGRSVI